MGIPPHVRRNQQFRGRPSRIASNFSRSQAALNQPVSTGGRREQIRPQSVTPRLSFVEIPAATIHGNRDFQSQATSIFVAVLQEIHKDKSGSSASGEKQEAVQRYQAKIEDENTKLNLSKDLGRVNHPPSFDEVGFAEIIVDTEAVQRMATLPRDLDGNVIYYDPKLQEFWIRSYAEDDGGVRYVEVHMQLEADPSGQCTPTNPSGQRAVLMTHPRPTLRNSKK